ncbi:hypothetical protein J8Z82_20035 [Yersinia enterocolitica]|uniref:hypothetical protein n=1 Tax=Yersinia enterocolitica TaxID=630 RepID=UPI001C8E08FB|nr:hypothetical protein [Yersinia enterocolitica]MBX9489755.1 hypothetical protein [Yersinia enterocolitica]MBX9494028.1 hypothetical protein [Yersinia enterocolitica]
MLDNIEPDSPENTTSALSHLAFCALVALGIARQDGMAGTPYAENLFLICSCSQSKLPRLAISANFGPH